MFTMDIDRNVQNGCADIHNVLNEGANLGVYWVDPDAVVQRVQVRRRSRRDFMRYFGQWRDFCSLELPPRGSPSMQVRLVIERGYGISHLCCPGCVLRPRFHLVANFILTSPRD
jgi:hypothetical protein